MLQYLHQCTKLGIKIKLGTRWQQHLMYLIQNQYKIEKIVEMLNQKRGYQIHLHLKIEQCILCKKIPQYSLLFEKQSNKLVFLLIL